MTYLELTQVLRNRDERKPSGVATTLRRVGDAIAIRYHDTDVVTVSADDTYTLDSGGWRTVTTKARINEYSPARLYQQKGVWYLSTPTGRIPFADGMAVDSDGIPPEAMAKCQVDTVDWRPDAMIPEDYYAG